MRNDASTKKMFRQLSLLLLSLSVPLLQAQDLSDKAKMLIGTFNVYNFRTVQYSSTMSFEITELFCSTLDANGIVLTAEDLRAINKDREKFLSEVEQGKNDYFENAAEVYKRALLRMDSMIGSVISSTLNFLANDTAYFIPFHEKGYHSPDNKYHGKRAERFVKARGLERALNTEENEKLTEAEILQKAAAYAKTIAENFQADLRLQIPDARQTVETALLNAIALRYDPHSNYFDESQKKEFDKGLAARIESFGFIIDKDEDENIIIAGIEPGGSAWLSNQVNEGDLFLSVKIGMNLYSNSDKSIEEIEQKLVNCEEKEIVITVKKKNGQIKKVKLVKQKVASADNNIKGYVLTNGKQKLGYMSLPSFYTDGTNVNLPGCANDVAKEILKLEKDTISGLIIDLRNNGGGSMLEAMNLAGIFVDEGPLFIYKEKNRKPALLKDINRGSIFKKPIVVMINETSASASELFSNIVKDYNLGVVVGQTSYGKGTAQNIIPLDTNVIRSKALYDANKDFIKITNGKFYRLNCSTHQGTGVRPDVFFPKYPAFSAFKESKEAYFIPPDTVTKKVVFTPNPPINMDRLRDLSGKRISGSPAFKRFTQSADSLEQHINFTHKVLIKYKEYKSFKAKADKLFESFENAAKLGRSVKCLNNTFDEKLQTYNEAVSQFNNEVIKNIEQDLFINESFLILTDLINP
jgi:carboxyl-terminal processing protease